MDGNKQYNVKNSKHFPVSSWNTVTAGKAIKEDTMLFGVQRRETIIVVFVFFAN